MKSAWLIAPFLALCLAGALGVVGCGGGDGGDDTVTTNTVTVTNAPSVNNVAGNWSGPIVADGGPSGTMTLGLSQAGDALVGNYSDNFGDAGSVSGSIDGKKLNLTATMTVPAGTVVSFKGTLNDAGNQISGTYSTVTGPSQDGTWTVSK